LSTVYIGALRNDPVEVASVLGLPQGVAAVFGLCVGYAAADVAGEVKPRPAQVVVASGEQYRFTKASGSFVPRTMPNSHSSSATMR
jgi:nitroreductase